MTADRLCGDMDSEQSDVTRLLKAWSNGDSGALERLMPIVFDDLRRIAKRYFDREASGHTLQPTALVNEVYLRLVDQRSVSWRDRIHFFGVAAKLIRRVLVDHARKRQTAKRGSGAQKVTFDEALDLPDVRDADLIALDDALTDLAKLSRRQSRIVELRFFVGLTFEEVAAVEKLSRSTVIREWNHSKLWLTRELSPR